MKKTITKDYRVVVSVAEPYWVIRDGYHQTMYREAEDLRVKIARILDATDLRCAGVRSEYTSLDVCEFCEDRAGWDNNLDEDGCPCCCSKAVDEWDAAHPPKVELPELKNE